MANDTSLTFPSPEVNHIFPSEDAFSAATKLLGLLEKRQVNLSWLPSTIICVLNILKRGFRCHKTHRRI